MKPDAQHVTATNPVPVFELCRGAMKVLTLLLADTVPNE